MEMNLQLHHVVSDITGATGMRIIRAVVNGERDPEVLAAFRDVRCKSSMDTIKAVLVGNDREEHVFALTQSLELYDFYKVQIEACDRKIKAAVGALTVRAENGLAPLPKARVKGKQQNAPSFDVRAALYGVLGTALTQIHGLGSSSALKLVAECGTDLRAWKNAKHFTRHGSVWPRATISQVASYCLREHADLQAAQLPSRVWLPAQLAEAIRHWARSTEDSHRALASRRTSRRQRARSPCCFTTLFAMA